KLETALARSLLRPLGLQEPLFDGGYPPPTGPELEALWELAGQQREGVRQRFVSEALRSSVFTRQLRRQADLALHAAVGLDLRRHLDVEGLLLARLRESGVPEERRTDIALAAAALGGLSPPAADAFGRALTQALSKGTDPRHGGELARGLVKVAA